MTLYEIEEEILKALRNDPVLPEELKRLVCVVR